MHSLDCLWGGRVPAALLAVLFAEAAGAAGCPDPLRDNVEITHADTIERISIHEYGLLVVRLRDCARMQLVLEPQYPACRAGREIRFTGVPKRAEPMMARFYGVDSEFIVVDIAALECR